MILFSEIISDALILYYVVYYDALLESNYKDLSYELSVSISMTQGLICLLHCKRYNYNVISLKEQNSTPPPLPPFKIKLHFGMILIRKVLNNKFLKKKNSAEFAIFKQLQYKCMES